jgi:uncharacterized protein HemY
MEFLRMSSAAAAVLYFHFAVIVMVLRVGESTAQYQVGKRERKQV